MTFRLLRLRLKWTAGATVRFRAFAAANALRGGLGEILRTRGGDAFTRIFEPPPAENGPSGFKDPPRPFVIRAAHLNGATFEAGEKFHFDLHLFDTAPDLATAALNAFAELAAQQKAQQTATIEPVSLDLKPPEIPITELLIAFETPTELKSGGVLSTVPEFGILYSRARDRVSTLRALYGDGHLPLNFAETGHAAQAIQLVQGDLQIRQATRTSGRTGQTHPLGGFVGKAHYRGDCTQFVGILKAAEWTGVGTKTVWGNGQIRLL